MPGWDNDDWGVYKRCLSGFDLNLNLDGGLDLNLDSPSYGLDVRLSGHVSDQ